MPCRGVGPAGAPASGKRAIPLPLSVLYAARSIVSGARIFQLERQLAARDERISRLEGRNYDLEGQVAAAEYAAHEAHERRCCPRCFGDLFG
jgi:hypothetical protein